MANNDNYEYMKFLDITGAQQIWNTAKQTFVQTVNGQGIDANGNCQVATGAPLDAYPVNSIYTSVSNTSPASLFGGTWQQLKDRFLLGAGDTYTNGATGGEATHNHSLDSQNAIANIQWDSGQNKIYIQEIRKTTWQANVRFGISNGESISQGNQYGTGLQGNTENANNMPPYLVVYMWKRTA